MRNGIEKGHSVDRVVASKPSAAFDAKCVGGGGFLGRDAFVQIVYASVAGQ